MRVSSVLAVAWLFVLGGCTTSGSDVDVGSADTGVLDASANDARTSDVGLDASATTDAATVDAALVDSPTIDAAPPSCTDGRQNGDETDVDCGGSCTTKCAPGKHCALSTDCQSGICMGGVCS